MRKVGVRSVTFSIESGSQKMLNAMGKQTTVEQTYEAIRMVFAAGLQCYADLFLGFLGEIPDMIKETSYYLMKVEPTGINMVYVYPLHDIEFYKEAKQNNTLLGDWGMIDGYPRV